MTTRFTAVNTMDVAMGDEPTRFVPTLRYDGKEMDINELMLAKMPYDFDAPRENEGVVITDQERVFYSYWYHRMPKWALAWAIGRSYQALRNAVFSRKHESLNPADFPSVDTATSKVLNKANVPEAAEQEYQKQEKVFSGLKVRATRDRRTIFGPRPKGSSRGPLKGTKKRLGANHPSVRKAVRKSSKAVRKPSKAAKRKHKTDTKAPADMFINNNMSVDTDMHANDTPDSDVHTAAAGLMQLSLAKQDPMKSEASSPEAKHKLATFRSWSSVLVPGVETTAMPTRIEVAAASASTAAVTRTRARPWDL